MAKTIRIMSWNMRNWGGPARRQVSLADFVVETIVQWQPQIAAIMEIRANEGHNLGTYLCAQLSATVGGAWRFQESGQTGSLREQYLFLWDSTQVSGTNFFPTPAHVLLKQTYEDSAGAPLGFPRIGSVAKKHLRPYENRPPFRGRFHEPTTGTTLPIYVFHAESAVVRAEDGCKNLAAIKELAIDPRGIFMGDFNIHPSDVLGTNARAVRTFSPLHHTQGYLQQISNDDLTSMKHYSSAGAVPTTAAPTAADIQTCLSKSYDNFYVKLGGFAIGNHAIVTMVEDCIYRQSLHDALATYVKDKAHLPATPVFNNLQESFTAYAHYLSDHLPILLEVTFQ